jgi:predicted RNase H-related nuclease YkuK (DUF458 family)
MIKVKRKLLIVLAGCLSILLVLFGGRYNLAGKRSGSSRADAVTFEKTFGTTGGDSGYSVAQTRDGGYIIVGITGASVSEMLSGMSDILLVKTDSKGDQIWQKTFGGSRDDFGYSLAQTQDGGYIIAGGTYSFGAGGKDVYMIKTDSKGNKIWQKTFGGGDEDLGLSVVQTSDGGYVIVGTTYSFGAGACDVYMIKTDSRGNKIWQKTFGGKSEDKGFCVAQTRDGGYIIVGTTRSFGALGIDIYLIKTDSRGNKMWQKTFGGKGQEQGFSVIQASDGGYVIVGETYSFGKGEGDVYLIKTDSKGNKVWQKTFGGKGWDWGNCVAQMSDGGYIIVGGTSSFGAGGIDVYLVKTDSKGDQIWQKTFGGSSIDEGKSVQQTRDGGYIIAGTTYSFGAGGKDIYLIKTDPKGNVYKKKR